MVKSVNALPSSSHPHPPLTPSSTLLYLCANHIGLCHFMPDDYSQPPVSVPSEELCGGYTVMLQLAMLQCV